MLNTTAGVARRGQGACTNEVKAKWAVVAGLLERVPSVCQGLSLMPYTSQDQLESLVLKSLYDFVQTDSGRLSAPDLANRLQGEFTPDRVRMALQALDRADFVQSAHSSYGGSTYTINEKGYRKVEQLVLASEPASGAAPASDRLVAFNHNSPEFSEIRDGIRDLYESLRGANELTVDENERSRIAHSLLAAVELWEAVQLKAIQVKIGILMAVEDARNSLAATAKAVSAALLIDAIKALVKSHTGLDLDKI